MKSIVVCADDYAVHEAASTAIVALARSGRLSATSAMVLSPRWDADAAPLRELRGTLDVGLHLDWTSDFAVAHGHGLSLTGAMVRAAWSGFSEAQARVVIEQQLDLFERQWKAPPDHVDGHQHVQQFAGVRQALVHCLAQRYGQPRPYLRISRATARPRAFKSRVIAALGAGALAVAARRAGVPCASELSGVYDFSSQPQRYACLMEGWLEQAAPGCILMCHPARAGARGDAIAPARALEFDYLGSDGFAAALQRHGVSVVRGAGLFALPH